jgi:DNA-binding transcriptional LysR family regulator
MELRQLRAFVEVADSGHFRVAAERLRLTQPALTQRIQALERELGLQLLERNARAVRLAPAGTVLLRHARRLVQTEDEALRGLKAYSSGNVGHLAIAYQAAGDVTTAGWIIAEYRRRFPSVEIETTSGSSGGKRCASRCDRIIPLRAWSQYRRGRCAVCPSPYRPRTQIQD